MAASMELERRFPPGSLCVLGDDPIRVNCWGEIGLEDGYGVGIRLLFMKVDPSDVPTGDLPSVPLTVVRDGLEIPVIYRNSGQPTGPMPWLPKE